MCGTKTVAFIESSATHQSTYNYGETGFITQKGSGIEKPLICETTGFNEKKEKDSEFIFPDFSYTSPSSLNATDTKNSWLLGFRSGKLWKKVISVFYIFSCATYLLTIFFQDKKASGIDFFLDVLFELLMLLFMVSPYIFLSNTKFRNKVPLFKDYTWKSSFLGMVIVACAISVAMSFVLSFHSVEYKSNGEEEGFVIIEKQDATCTEKGYIKKMCDNCDHVTVEDIEPLGHDFRNSKCSRCGEKR
jgi:hypothetical protein